MSRAQLIPSMRQLVAGALLGVAAASGVAVPSASAEVQTKTLDYQCRVPLAGTLPVSVKFDVDLPDRLPVSEPAGPFPISAVATIAGIEGGWSLIEGLTAVEGSAVLTTSTVVPGGQPTINKFPIAIAKTTFPNPGSGLTLNAAGLIPSMTINEAGPASISLQKFALNLKFTDSAGDAIIVPPATVDIDTDQPVQDSDGNPETVDVFCRLTSNFGTRLGFFRLDAPPIPPVPYAFDAAGSAELKNLVKGTVPLKGDAVLRVGGSPTVLGDRLTLAPTQARLVGLGFLPVTAKIAFVSSGSLSGHLLTFTGEFLAQQVRIKVLEAKLFGAIPLAGGNNCQTKSLTTLMLYSQGFSLARGGTFTGQFTISDLNGCGALNGLVSPVVAGGGNTVSLTLTPKA